MKKVTIIITLIMFILMSLVVWSNGSATKAEEINIKKYEVKIQTKYFLGKIRGTENDDLLGKIIREGHILFWGTSSTHYITASTEQIHKIVKFMKEVGGKDIINEFKVLVPGTSPREVQTEGGLISTSYFQDENIESVFKLLESQTKYSFEYGEDVKGRVDLVALEAPPLEIAFDIILKENGYDYKTKDNTIHVYRKEEKPEKEPLSREERYQKYITIYRKMIKKYPEEKNWGAYAQNEIGELFIKMENYSRASKEFQKVVDNYLWSDYAQEAQKSINKIKLKHLKK